MHALVPYKFDYLCAMKKATYQPRNRFFFFFTSPAFLMRSLHLKTAWPECTINSSYLISIYNVVSFCSLTHDLLHFYICEQKIQLRIIYSRMFQKNNIKWEKVGNIESIHAWAQRRLPGKNKQANTFDYKQPILVVITTTTIAYTPFCSSFQSTHSRHVFIKTAEPPQCDWPHIITATHHIDKSLLFSMVHVARLCAACFPFHR